jgi:hypothetical protein
MSLEKIRQRTDPVGYCGDQRGSSWIAGAGTSWPLRGRFENAGVSVGRRQAGDYIETERRVVVK